MKLIGASIVVTCDSDFSIIKNGGILFNEQKIIRIGNFEELKNKNGRIEICQFYDSCVITPAFINAHIHFEFSKNYSTLKYGSFGEWLDSIIDYREQIINNSDNDIRNAIKESLLSGVGCVGAISSTGIDLDLLSESDLKVIFFNEIIGTNNQQLDAIKNNFDNRLKLSRLLENNNFKSGIAIHSPYSLSVELANYAMNKAIENKLLVSTHFLESKEELAWLESGEGYFKWFFKNKLNNDNASPNYSRDSFLDMFKKCESLFVHCLYLNNNDWEKISKLKSSIVSCPRSNRLLNNTYFDFLKAKDYKFPLIIATDGRSSNHSLSILDEARTALFAYEKYNINNLAKDVLLGITRNPAKRFKFNNGSIETGKASDFAIFYIRDISASSQIITNLLLHAQKVEDLYINGKRVNFENY